MAELIKTEIKLNISNPIVSEMVIGTEGRDCIRACFIRYDQN